MALFQLKTKPAADRMNRLKNMMISPTEKAQRFSSQIAMISVPSVEPPHLMTMPIPMPMMIPPNMVDRKASWVAGCISSKMEEHNESTTMAKVEDSASRSPRRR